MSETDGEHAGLADSLKRLSSTVAALAQNRLELALVEWREERNRLCGMLLLAAAGIVCCLMALIVLTFTIVVIFWDEHRVAVLACFGVAYLAGAGFTLMKLNSRLKDSEPFSATLAEFKKDRAWMDEQTASNYSSASKP